MNSRDIPMENDDNNGLVPSKLSFEDLKKVIQHGIESLEAELVQV